MRALPVLFVVLTLSSLTAQTAVDAKVAGPALAVTAPGPQDYVCPMDSDIRSHSPGTCPRCGMSWCSVSRTRLSIRWS
jgi:hypothetical protein